MSKSPFIWPVLNLSWIERIQLIEEVPKILNLKGKVGWVFHMHK